MKRITAMEVSEAIKSLKNGKTAGLDNMYGEHYKYAHNKIHVLLALLFNAMIIHNFLPKAFMDTTLVPLIKDRKGIVTSSDNYRPLAITCVVSKILELILLERYNDLLQTSDNQFGFKKKHATDMCIYTLKHVVDYFQSMNSAVYICFLDASKAFDKVNHWKLFHKLIVRNVPYIIVRILVTWYATQLFYVSWGNTLSDSFTVLNGVRQGGILSPILFNVYMNDLSVLLNNVHIGCFINDKPYNHLFYADDSALLAPTPAALQKLISLCESYAIDADLTYNTKKTVCLSVLPKWLKNFQSPNLYLNGKVISFKQEHKYLGVILHNNMLDKSDIKQQIRATYSK